MARKCEEHTRLHKDFLLLSALIKNHKAQWKPHQNDRSHWKPCGTDVEQLNPWLEQLPDQLQPSTHRKRFNLMNRKYSYRRSHQSKNDPNGPHGVDPPQDPNTLSKPVPLAGDPLVMVRERKAGQDAFRKSEKYHRGSGFPQKSAKLHQSSTSQRPHPYHLRAGISNDSLKDETSAGDPKKHLQTSVHAPGVSDSAKRIVTVLPKDKILQKVRIVAGHSLPESRFKISSSSLNSTSHNSGMNYSVAESMVSKNANQSKNDSQDNKISPSLRMDAVRAACLESLAALEKTKHVGSTSEQLQDKDCEVARIKALSAYLSQLNRQKGNRFVEREGVCSNQKGSTAQVSTKASQRGDIVHTISPKISPSRGNANTKDILSVSRSCLGDRQVHGRNRMRVQQATPGPSSGASVDVDKATSTQRQIQGLRDDIKRLEEMLSKNMAATITHTKTKEPQTPTSTVHTQGCKLKSSRLSNHGNRYKMTRKKMLAPKTVSKERYSLQKQNPFKKLNSSVNVASTGSMSLHKTRSRYKVRKSAQSLSDSKRVSQGRSRNRQGRRKDVPPMTDRSSLRPSKLTEHYPRSPMPHRRAENLRHSPRYGSPASCYRTQHKQLDRRYSPQLKKYGHRNWRGLWNNPNDPNSFISRRLQHVVAHSPMLYRTFSLGGGNFRHHRLGDIWHSPKLWANRLRWQPLPQRFYSFSVTPRRTPSRLPRHSPSAGSERWLRHSSSKHSTAAKTGNKKVMNVVKLGGVRYARRGKSLQRLARLQDSSQKTGSSGHRPHQQELRRSPSSTAYRLDRKITNTKIVAQPWDCTFCGEGSLHGRHRNQRSSEARDLRPQVLQRSIFYNRLSRSRKKHRQEYCMFYNRFGRCNKGTSCPYKHDPDKVAVCTRRKLLIEGHQCLPAKSRYLRGTCKPTGGLCPFSHKVSRDKMPVCRFFLRGICTQADCPYSHVKVNDSASVCRDFVRGFCPRGEKCTQKHLLECAEFTENGSCSRKHCPLWHKRGRKQSAGEHPKGRKTAWKRVPKVMKKSNRGPENVISVHSGRSGPSVKVGHFASNEPRKHTPPLVPGSTFLKTEDDKQTETQTHITHEEPGKNPPSEVSHNASNLTPGKGRPSAVSDDLEVKEEQGPTAGNSSGVDSGRRSRSVKSDTQTSFDKVAQRMRSPPSDKSYSTELLEDKSSEIVENASFIELEKDEEHIGPGEMESIKEEVPQPPLQIRPIFLKIKR